MTKRYRVLQIAEAANPEWASVPLIGWSLSRALAKLTDAHLLTHVRNRQALVRAGLSEGVEFTAIDNEYVASPLYRLSSLLRGGTGKGWTTMMAFSSLTYYSFEWEVWRKFGDRIRSGEFDLVHRITPLSPTSPSIIAKRLSQLKIPFVVGPLNGGVPWPKNFVDRQYSEKEWLSHLRGLYKFMPGYGSTRAHSSAIIAGSKHTLGEMPAWTQRKCVYIPENGVDLELFRNPRGHQASLPLKAIFLGRLVPYKGADLLLEATAEFLKAGNLELHIVGDGPQKCFLEAMVDRLGVRSSVEFHGWVPHGEVQSKLRVCDFLALPSIREFGGGVVVEAMALALTPIVADYAGPSELVDERTGIKVAFHNRKSLVDGMHDAIGRVIQSPKILDELGIAARKNVIGKLTWEAKAHQILSLYQDVLAGRNDFSCRSYY
jgi:glycosyltransferase involved in cell wall biosynthesis